MIPAIVKEGPHRHRSQRSFPGLISVIRGVEITFILLINFFLLSCSTVPPAVDVDPNTWEIDGMRIHHFEKGQGQPILVVHGGPGIPFSHPVAGLDPLTDRYRFVYFDQRGCGRSTHPFIKFEEGKTGKHIWQLMSTLGYKKHVSDMESIRKWLGEDRLILMGHSFGAVLAGLYAQQYPDRVKAMILIAPAGTITSEPGVDMFKIMEQKLPESELPGFQSFKDEYFDFEGAVAKTEDQLRRLNLQFGEYWLKAMTTGENTITFEDLPNDTASVGGFMPYGLYFSFGKEWDFTGGLKNITAPVLIIHGQRDLQPLSISEIYRDHLPNAELKVISRAGHFPFVETPEEFNALIAEFLKTVVEKG